MSENAVQTGILHDDDTTNGRNDFVTEQGSNFKFSDCSSYELGERELSIDCYPVLDFGRNHRNMSQVNVRPLQHMNRVVTSSDTTNAPLLFIHSPNVSDMR